ncbi:hypothetical protein H696_06254 [Fonticula alba]|uniref:Uncharacterized protein n=1 Tax=Fonticula alba TaxID=691883 RepID=A0A058YZM1_FONAL|nr:hypothetical protein H696_06254 [Fonticula alba]KCV67321.1 hypothetical protein H696_06254 [Fonticula alba]|eukprot:XP_009498274.1 hypothetical protein H696_06254 [Fonticula alba]
MAWEAHVRSLLVAEGPCYVRLPETRSIGEQQRESMLPQTASTLMSDGTALATRQSPCPRAAARGPGSLSTPGDLACGQETAPANQVPDILDSLRRCACQVGMSLALESPPGSRSCTLTEMMAMRSCPHIGRRGVAACLPSPATPPLRWDRRKDHQERGRHSNSIRSPSPPRDKPASWALMHGRPPIQTHTYTHSACSHLVFPTVAWEPCDVRTKAPREQGTSQCLAPDMPRQGGKGATSRGGA